MKATQLSVIIILASVLMGCQIEVSPFDNEQLTEPSASVQAATAAEEPADTDEEPVASNGSGDSNTGTETQTSPPVTTKSIALTWDIPVERENNEQLFLYEIGGYEIEYRKVGETSYKSIKIEDGYINTYSVTELEAGDYEIRIAAYDVNGLYSKFSDSAVLPTI